MIHEKPNDGNYSQDNDSLTAPDWLLNAPIPDYEYEYQEDSFFNNADISSISPSPQLNGSQYLNGSHPTNTQASNDTPQLKDAWDTSRNQPQPAQVDFDPDAFIAQPITPPVKHAQLESLSDSDVNQYIDSHTPHAWLDSYIEHSRTHSPRGFNLLHEMAGLWAMSATVAGRVNIHFGGRWRNTSLMIAAVARSSVWVKSHTIGIARRLLNDAGQKWRMLPTKASPQAIIEEMANDKRIVELMSKLESCNDDKERESLNAQLDRLKTELGALFGHEGQRAWYLSEFGTKIIAGMMRPGSPLADFSDFLRDVNEQVNEDYVYRTRGHGREVIREPYLAIIADTTPADIKPHARAGAPLWSNGFFPRFAIITPLDDEKPSKARVAYGVRTQAAIPHQLKKVIVEVDERLGKRASYNAPLIKLEMGYSFEVYKEIYEYEAWIDAHRLGRDAEHGHDLDGTYSRLFSEQSVSIAALLAIFDGGNEILTHHYQRAKEICERIRKCTETFYTRMTANTLSEKDIQKSQKEDRILRIIESYFKKKEAWPTLREIRKRTGPTQYRMSNEELFRILDVLKEANLIEEFKAEKARSFRYKLT